MRNTNTPNTELQRLIEELCRISSVEKVKIWKRVASDLSKPTRQRRIVNLSRINQYSKDNETIVVPGKVLGDGAISHKVMIAAFSFSDQAKKKIEDAGAKAMSIEELVTKNPKGKSVRIIG